MSKAKTERTSPAKLLARRPMPSTFLLRITEDAAKRLPGFPLLRHAKGYFIECASSESIRHGDYVAAALDVGWVLGVVDTKHPERTKRVSISVPADAEMVSKGIETVPVAFERSEVFAIVEYRVNILAKRR